MNNHHTNTIHVLTLDPNQPKNTCSNKKNGSNVRRWQLKSIETTPLNKNRFGSDVHLAFNDICGTLLPTAPHLSLLKCTKPLYGEGSKTKATTKPCENGNGQRYTYRFFFSIPATANLIWRFRVGSSITRELADGADPSL